MAYAVMWEFADDINCEFYERGMDHLYRAVLTEETQDCRIGIVSASGGHLIRRIRSCSIGADAVSRHENAMRIVGEIL